MKLTHAQLHAHKQYECTVDKTHSVTQLLQHLGHKTEIMNTCDRSVGKTVLSLEGTDSCLHPQILYIGQQCLWTQTI